MKNIYNIVFLFIFCTFSIFSYSQISHEGKPYYYGKNNIKSISYIEMPVIDFSNQIKNVQNSSLKPLRFAYPFKVNLSPENSGSWNIEADGSKIWRLGIKSEKAYSLNIIFSSYNLLERVQVFLYDPDMQYINGSYNHKNNNTGNTLAIKPVPGDEIIIELQAPPGMDEYGSLVIGQVAHDYINIFSEPYLKDGNFGRSGSCNIDINCKEGFQWQDDKYAVARIIISGRELCTGSIINTTSDNETPYFLTANHCINDSVSAMHSVFYFDYESPYCQGPDGSTDQTLSGALLKATSNSLDFTLLEFVDQPPYTFNTYYAGWNAKTSPPSKSTTIHHPWGDVKKISYDNDPAITGTFPEGIYDPNAHWHILRWDAGTTEGGSSGCPLFNEDHQIVGNLTGGSADCDFPVNDYYAKFSKCWNAYSDTTQQLKHWLDPENTGRTYANSYVPKTTGTLSANFTANTTSLCIGDTVVFTDASTGDVALYNWNFGDGANPRVIYSSGPHKVIFETSGVKAITLEIINGNSSSTHTKYITVKESPVACFTYVVDDTLVTFENTSTNAIAYNWNFGDGETSNIVNPTHLYKNNGLYLITLTSTHENGCTDIYTDFMSIGIVNTDNELVKHFEVFPNPSSGMVHILPLHSNAKYDITVYNLLGEKMNMHYTGSENEYVLDLRNQPSGIYLIVLKNTLSNDIWKVPVILK